MQFDQGMASIIKYVLTKSGNPTPYYNKVPESFNVPAVYFPMPEIKSQGHTLSAYALNYVWYIKFFHRDTPSAYALGLPVLLALQGGRNIVPLIDGGGNHTGEKFLLKNPSLKRLDSDGAAQLTLSWDSPRPYGNCNDEPAEKMMSYDLNINGLAVTPKQNK